MKCIRKNKIKKYKYFTIKTYSKFSAVKVPRINIKKKYVEYIDEDMYAIESGFRVFIPANYSIKNKYRDQYIDILREYVKLVKEYNIDLVATEIGDSIDSEYHFMNACIGDYNENFIITLLCDIDYRMHQGLRLLLNFDKFNEDQIREIFDLLYEVYNINSYINLCFYYLMYYMWRIYKFVELDVNQLSEFCNIINNKDKDNLYYDEMLCIFKHTHYQIEYSISKLSDDVMFNLIDRFIIEKIWIGQADYILNLCKRCLKSEEAKLKFELLYGGV